MATESKRWTEQEFAGLDLGDARLDKRAKILMERLAANPSSSIPLACNGWGETCAAYRFLRNPEVEWHAILAPHWEQTQQRMRAYPVVLCLQDTTELDFNGQETEGHLVIHIFFPQKIKNLHDNLRLSREALINSRNQIQAKFRAICTNFVQIFLCELSLRLSDRSCV